MMGGKQSQLLVLLTWTGLEFDNTKPPKRGGRGASLERDQTVPGFSFLKASLPENVAVNLSV